MSGFEPFDKVCLRRPYFKDDDITKILPGGGNSYCGNACFGFGAKGTFDLKDTTCRSCKDYYKLEQERNEKRNART